ncbi:MAG TPA: acyl-CoA dehydrogenase family protein [Armatimonadota bacterium]|jgi:alkylation response protein AidB-like acyl-CoA dehydrogenase
MNFSLTASEQSVLDDALCVAPRIAGRAAAADREMRFPVEDLRDLDEAGLMALAVPPSHGGRGASTVAFVNACEIIAAADASLAVAWVMHTACGWEIAHSAVPETGKAVIDDVLHTGAFICVAGAEGRGPDGARSPLLCRRDGADWLLDGHKGFASGCDAATYAVTGGTDADGARHSFIVRMDNRGISISERWDGMGMCASASHGLAFSHCRIADAWRLTGDYRAGDFRNTSALFGLGLAATALGISRAALAFALPWCAERGISDANKVRLGGISVRTEAVRSLLWRSAWEVDRDPAGAEPWVDRAKTLAVETAQEVTIEAMRVCGGHSFRRKYPLERHARDAVALLLQGQRPDQLRAGVADSLLKSEKA